MHICGRQQRTEKREVQERRCRDELKDIQSSFLYFYSLCPGCEETCSAPCDQRKKNSFYKLYIYLQKEGSITAVPTLVKSQRIT